MAARISEAARALYARAAEHARARGIIIADTKFEFGMAGGDELILVDEVLTPDSSRFWAAAEYAPGRAQASFDKQYVRDWMKAHGLDRAAQHGTRVTLPDDVVQRTADKYRDAFRMITGRAFA